MAKGLPRGPSPGRISKTSKAEQPRRSTQQDKPLFCAKLGDTFGGTIFRFRLSGEKRLWGFRKGATFHAVLWDPEHKVFPTEPS